MIRSSACRLRSGTGTDRRTAAPAVRSAEGFRQAKRQRAPEKITPLQYAVTQREDTENPFRNIYWDNHERYLCSTSWSESRSSARSTSMIRAPVAQFHATARAREHSHQDRSHSWLSRTEVRSAHADSTSGTRLDDGPRPTGCATHDSAAMRFFIQHPDWNAEGYGQYAMLFRQRRPSLRSSSSSHETFQKGASRSSSSLVVLLVLGILSAIAIASS